MDGLDGQTDRQEATAQEAPHQSAASRPMIRLSSKSGRTKNMKSSGQATERSALNSLNSQQILEIQQNLNAKGTKRNSRVNSQGFNELAMAAIQAANGLVP